MSNATRPNISADCSDCPCQSTFQAWYPYHVGYQTVVCFLGIAANLLILVTLIAARISHSCHVYVLTLTLADLLFCLTRLALFHYTNLPQGVMDLWLCRLLFSVYNLSRGIANWVMVMLAIDRLRVVASPLRTHSQGRRTQCAAIGTCIACFAILAINLPRFLYLGQYQDLLDKGEWYGPFCSLLNTELALALRGVELALTVQIPVVANAVVNIILCYCIWDMRKRRRRLSHVPSASRRRSTPAAPKTDDAERQLTQMLLATSIMHSVFSLPIACLEIVNLKYSFVRTNDYFLYLCINYGMSIFYSWQVFINLPIYLLYNTAFRNRFLTLLLPCCFSRVGGNRGEMSAPSRSKTNTSVSHVSETNL